MYRVKVGCCGSPREMKRNSSIYSLGTSTRSKAELTGLLQNHGIEMVIDVRRFPTSRIEHFKQQSLVQLLAQVQKANLGTGQIRLVNFQKIFARVYT